MSRKDANLLVPFILLTPIVVRNTLVGRLRPRSARGRLQTKPERHAFCNTCKFVTHRNSYIETTDRRDFDGKPSDWRWGRVISWKIPEFCSVGAARSKKQTWQKFCVSYVPFDFPARSLYTGDIFTPNQSIESRNSEGVLLLVWESVTRHLVDGWRVPKSGHVTITKIENLHMYARRKIHTDSINAILFDLRRKINEVIAEKPCQNSGVTGACERLAVLNWRSSSIHPSNLFYSLFLCTSSLK